MTIFSVAGGERALTVRYVPLVAWSFVALAAFGVIQILVRIASGLTPLNLGSLVALAVLLGFTGFVAYSGGELVLATFDRNADLVRVRSYGLTGLKLEERRLSEVTGLDIRILRRAQHRVELRFKSGERLPLTRYYVVTLNNRGLERLSSLLGVKPKLIDPVRGLGV
jgi:hypothetical protein